MISSPAGLRTFSSNEITCSSKVVPETVNTSLALWSEVDSTYWLKGKTRPRMILPSGLSLPTMSFKIEIGLSQRSRRFRQDMTSKSRLKLGHDSTSSNLYPFLDSILLMTGETSVTKVFLKNCAMTSVTLPSPAPKSRRAESSRDLISSASS